MAQEGFKLLYDFSTTYPSFEKFREAMKELGYQVEVIDKPISMNFDEPEKAVKVLSYKTRKIIDEYLREKGADAGYVLEAREFGVHGTDMSIVPVKLKRKANSSP